MFPDTRLCSISSGTVQPIRMPTSNSLTTLSTRLAPPLLLTKPRPFPQKLRPSFIGAAVEAPPVSGRDPHRLPMRMEQMSVVYNHRVRFTRDTVAGSHFLSTTDFISESTGRRPRLRNEDYAGSEIGRYVDDVITGNPTVSAVNNYRFSACQALMKPTGGLSDGAMKSLLFCYFRK